MSQHSVIIPCYNDTDLLPGIVSEIEKSSHCGEIIIVDDGSDKKHKDVLQLLSGIRLYTHTENLGKAAALRTGVSLAALAGVTFIDADVKNFHSRHLDFLVNKTEEGYGMVIGIRECDPFVWKWLGWDRAYTGERAFRNKEDLVCNGLLNVSGYCSEPSMNKYFFHNGKVGAVLLDGVVQQSQYEKKGFARGLISYVISYAKMLSYYLRFLGLREFLFQLWVARKLQKSV